ncbi:OPT oligopeptide transporter [Pisolithus orientalis]|uniref:OPT oligopeptide transporter n=1 Tax=Pisolithus orientalis TaxID=936130 RepID=UPI002223FDBB|nr:OPT oligopeptide transporter [Pisolithus orientalis]KAI6005109.1 OPT oligopeptide transporter [Pisolithus orientalis]
MEPKAYSSATDVAVLPTVRHRGIPDVPEDVDFLMEHLNDPNFDYGADFRSSMDASTEIYELEHNKTADAYSTMTSDLESHSHRSMRYSTASRTDTPSSSFEYDDSGLQVSSVDDPTMPVNTFRMWFLGLSYAVLISGLNQFFSNAISLSALERVLPTTRFCTLGYTWSLNPGPFNIKEHVVITVMANLVVNGAYATDILATQRSFYNQSLSNSYQYFLVLATQLIGFSLGGLLRRFLVYPCSMIWPGALVNSALFNTLHRTYGKPERRHISRGKFFAIVVACSFLWYFLPGYLWTGLSVFNWVCWIVPTNVAVNSLFGTSTGLGMGLLTFDWSMISYIGSPLVTPWWSEANTAVGLVTNSWYMQYLPMSASVTFDNTGMPYDPTQIVTNGTFDESKYAAYSPAFMPSTLAIAYGVAFAAFASVVVHTLLWYRRDIVRRFRSDLRDERDVHSRLMQAYPEVPQWWYATLGIVMLLVFIIVVEVFPTDLPIWALCVALLLAALMSVPAGILQAITNQQIALNVMYELLGGYLLPGKPIAVMIFKAAAFAGTTQAVGFSGDLKLGHYMKIPPRLMFTAQVIAALVSSLVVISVQNWMFTNIVDICQPNQPDYFTCPSTTVFATSSLIWGGIGPQRLFSPGAMYSPLLWFFFIGAVLPIPFYYLARRFPLSYWRYINIPVLFAGIGAFPPATGINYSSWVLVGFIFQWFMRRYHFRWWMRYNYILSAGLDAGVAIGILFIFFALQMPKGGIQLNWWGNVAWQNTADALGTPMRTVAQGQTFGPSSW